MTAEQEPKRLDGVIDRGDGVFLAGDSVAAPGLLSEVAVASGIEAGRLALAVAVAAAPTAA